MRELVLESAGGEPNEGCVRPATLLADKELRLPDRLSHTRREGSKCKDRAYPRTKFSDQLEPAPYLLKRREGLIEILPCVVGRDLATDPRLTLRHHRVTKPGDEHPFG